MEGVLDGGTGFSWIGLVGIDDELMEDKVCYGGFG